MKIYGFYLKITWASGQNPWNPHKYWVFLVPMVEGLSWTNRFVWLELFYYYLLFRIGFTSNFFWCGLWGFCGADTRWSVHCPFLSKCWHQDKAGRCLFGFRYNVPRCDGVDCKCANAAGRGLENRSAVMRWTTQKNYIILISEEAQSALQITK